MRFGGAQVGKLTIQSQAEDLAPAQQADRKPAKPRAGSTIQQQKSRPAVQLMHSSCEHVLVQHAKFVKSKLLTTTAYNYCPSCLLQCDRFDN